MPQRYAVVCVFALLSINVGGNRPHPATPTASTADDLLMDLTASEVAPLNEKYWCLNTWPARLDTNGRAFFMNQSGAIHFTDNEGQRHVGKEAPGANAAFAPGMTGHMSDKLAVKSEGRDGATWKTLR